MPKLKTPVELLSCFVRLTQGLNSFGRNHARTADRTAVLQFTMALQQKIREDGGSFLATLNGGLYQRLAWKWFFGDMQNSSDFSTRATRKTTRFSLRDAKYNAAGAMHRVAWALQTAKGTGQKCEKPWENLWFCSGEDRNRTFGCFPNVFWVVRILPLCSISIEVETMRRTTASPTRA
jgi:hypothetical protein